MAKATREIRTRRGRIQDGAVLSKFATVEMNEQLKDGEKERKQPGNGTQGTSKKKSLPNRRETESLNRSRVRVTQSWTIITSNHLECTRVSKRKAPRSVSWRCALRCARGVDVESDVAEETMSAMVKLAKAMCEPYDIGQPIAECQFRGLPGESWLHDEASTMEQKTVSSDGGRCAPQIDETVGILKWSKDETSTDLIALEKKGLDRKTNHQDLMKAETQPKPARPPPWRDKEEAARQEVEEERSAETEVQCCGLHPCTWSTRPQSKKV